MVGGSFTKEPDEAGLSKLVGRNHMKRILATATVVFGLTGCASGPTQQQLDQAYYGSETPQEECESIATRAINARLKDPGSAQYNFGVCEKGWLSSVPIMGYPVEYGYYIRGRVNARNSFGGYTGYKEFVVLTRDGAPVRAALADNDGMMLPWRP